MYAVQTQKGGFLVIVNQFYACYCDCDGNFIRSVENIEEEIAWAKEKWHVYEEKEFPEDKRETLEKSLQYINEYKESLAM